MLHEHLAPYAQNPHKHNNKRPLPAMHRVQRYFQAFGAEHRFFSLHLVKRLHLSELIDHFCDSLTIPAGKENQYESVYPQKITNFYPKLLYTLALLKKRSEEHTSELQSSLDIVFRLLFEIYNIIIHIYSVRYR